MNNHVGMKRTADAAKPMSLIYLPYKKNNSNVSRENNSQLTQNGAGPGRDETWVQKMPWPEFSMFDKSSRCTSALRSTIGLAHYFTDHKIPIFSVKSNITKGDDRVYIEGKDRAGRERVHCAHADDSASHDLTHTQFQQKMQELENDGKSMHVVLTGVIEIMKNTEVCSTRDFVAEIHKLTGNLCATAFLVTLILKEPGATGYPELRKKLFVITVMAIDTFRHFSEPNTKHYDEEYTWAKLFKVHPMLCGGYGDRFKSFRTALLKARKYTAISASENKFWDGSQFIVSSFSTQHGHSRYSIVGALGEIVPHLSFEKCTEVEAQPMKCVWRSVSVEQYCDNQQKQAKSKKRKKES